MENRIITINEHLYIELSSDINNLKIINNRGIPDIVFSITEDDKSYYIYCCEKLIGTVDKTTGKLSKTDIYIPTLEIKNYSEYINSQKNNLDYKHNKEEFEKDDNEYKNYSIELHTHFMEVLSDEEFLEVISDYIDSVPVDKEGYLIRVDLDENKPYELKIPKGTKWIPIEEAIKNPIIQTGLRFPVDRQLSFEDLKPRLNNRNGLVDLCAFFRASDDLYLKKDKLKFGEARNIRSNYKTEIYVRLLLKSLEVLKNQGVEYVEFSYSNRNTIKKIIDYLRAKQIHIDDITYKFLLSEDRTRKPKEFRNNPKNINDLLDNYEEVVGFDLMGCEDEILPRDFIKTDRCETLYDKLKFTIEHLLLSKRPRPTLRLHAGEFLYHDDNSLNDNPRLILEILKKIEDEIGVDLGSRLNIRIGHGIHFQETEEYFDLLKHFNVIIEFCVSSNFSLGNITNLSDMPYDIYAKHGIPFVIGTDGGGAYLTTLKGESKNTSSFATKEIIDRLEETSNNFIKNNQIPNINTIDDNPPINMYLSLDECINDLPDSIKNSNFVCNYNNSNNKKRFIKKYFFENYLLDIEEENYTNKQSEKEKVIQELYTIKRFYHNKIINESYYDSFDTELILDNIKKAKESIEEDNIVKAAIIIVSLQAVMGCETKLNKILFLLKAYNFTFKDCLTTNKIKRLKLDKKEYLKRIKEIDIKKECNKYLFNNKDKYEDINIDNIYIDKKEVISELNRTIKYFDNNAYKYSEELKEIFENIKNNILIYLKETDNTLELASLLVSLQLLFGMDIRLDKALLYMYINNKEVYNYLPYNDIYKNKGGKSR